MLQLIHFCLHLLSLTLCPSNSVSPSEPRTFSGRPCAGRSSSSTWCPQPWRGSMSCFQAIVSSARPSPPESALAKTLSHQWTGPAWLGGWCPDLDHNQASTTRRFCFLLMLESYLVLIWKTDESGIQCNWRNVLLTTWLEKIHACTSFVKAILFCFCFLIKPVNSVSSICLLSSLKTQRHKQTWESSLHHSSFCKSQFYLSVVTIK